VRDVLSTREAAIIAVSPTNIPVKFTAGASNVANVENLVGTERGNLLLSQVRDAIVVIAPFSYDPTGRIVDFVETNAENAIINKAGWKQIRSTSQIKGSTAIVTAVMYFRVGEDSTDDNLVSELVIQLQVIVRDVDDQGHEKAAIVYDEKEAVGTTSLESLAEGRVTRTVESGVSRFFGKFVGAYRRAKNAADKND
jgi:hypothetical protein